MGGARLFGAVPSAVAFRTETPSERADLLALTRTEMAERLARARRRAGPMKSRWLPPVWLVLATCAVLVSLTVYAWPWLRAVLSASPPQRHPWWFLTALFVHADPTVIPFYLHLLTNVAVIAFFGSRAERRLGSARTTVLVATAVAAQLVASRAMGIFGDGASGIAWALVPPALAGFVAQARRDGVGVLRSAAWWVAVALLGLESAPSLGRFGLGGQLATATR